MIGPGFSLLVENLGTTFEILICLMLFLGGIIFYAKDFKLGVMLHVLAFAGAFIVFYEKNLNYKLPIIILFLMFIVFSLTLIFFQKSTQPRGIA